MTICSRSTRRTMSIGSTRTAKSGEVLDKLPDPGLELYLPNHADLEAEVAQRAAQVVLNGDGLGLQQLAMRQQHPQFLTAQRLHMHWTVKPNPHHLRDATDGIVAVGLVDLRLQCARMCASRHT